MQHYTMPTSRQAVIRRPSMSIIVARAQNGVIGNHNQLPWKIKEDMQFFKTKTFGKAVIMGRKTYESIGKPLNGRLNIVITQNPNYMVPQGVYIARSLREAMHIAESYGNSFAADEYFIIGGESIYREAMGLAEKVYVTEVLKEFEGDSFFAEPAGDFGEISSQQITDTESHIPIVFKTFLRRRRLVA